MTDDQILKSCLYSIFIKVDSIKSIIIRSQSNSFMDDVRIGNNKLNNQTRSRQLSPHITLLYKQYYGAQI